MSSTALLEIDFQHWILDLGHRDPVPAAVTVRERLTGATVLCTRYLDRDASSPHGDPDHPSTAFHPALRPRPDDIIVTKYGKDVFANPDVWANLGSRGITDVVLTGVLTEHGVDLAARSAHRLGLRTTVIADACAASSATEHRRALAALAEVGVRCCPAADLPAAA